MQKELLQLLIEDGNNTNNIRIPASLKDRRLRPYDINTGNEEVLFGTLKHTGKNVHDFHVPNDPTLGYWNNFCLEDFARYWDLKNIYDAKYIYFQEIDFKNFSTPQRDIWPMKKSIDETIVDNGKEQGVHLRRPYGLYKYATTGVASFFAYMLYLSI